jgi:dTDP-4-dehydrorhamnose 3,5-epimerase
MLKIKKTKLKGLLLIEGKMHKDERGYLRELLIEEKVKQKFKFQLVSKSKKNVLRGLHFQYKKPQGKFISVIKGKIFDVAVDIRKNSVTFGKIFNIVLSEKNCKSIFIPPGFAHGFQTLADENIICYSCTQYRSVGNEHGLFFNDPFLKIKWPLKNPKITIKDQNAKKFKEIF